MNFENIEQESLISFNKLNIDDLFNDDLFNEEDLIDVGELEKSGMGLIDEKDLTRNQKEAISLATDWYKNRSKTDKVFVVGGTAGSGKPIPTNTIVPTPDGKRRFGDLKIGDYLFDRNGNKTKITAIYPQGILDNYEIKFSDGRKTNSGLGHLWSIINEKNELTTLELSEIISDYIKVEKNGIKTLKYKIPTNEMIKYEEKKLFIPPEKLGKFIASKLLDNTYHESNNLFNQILCDGMMSNNIFIENPIPDDYIYASADQRWFLIKGIMDILGKVLINKQNESILMLKMNRKDLLLQIQDIIHSLGFNSHLKKSTNAKNKEYSLSIEANDVEKQKFFTSEKLIKRIETHNCKKKEYEKSIFIQKITKVGKIDMMCIDVDNKEHLFLTNNYIVTHNCIHEDSILLYENKKGKIKDICVGDKIYGADGKLCSVLNVFPQAEKKKCYEIKFTDDSAIKADLEQLFNYSHDNNNFITDTLENIKVHYDNKEDIYFPLNKLIRFKNTILPIDPSVIGFLLNYDCLNFEFFHEYFTLYLNDSLFHAKDLIDQFIEKLKEYGLILNTMNIHRGVLSFTIFDAIKVESFKTTLEKLKIINENNIKHLPIEYIYTSFKNRKKLIESILNIDTVYNNNLDVKIDKNILSDFRFLIETTGGLVFNNEEESLIVFSNILSDIKSENLVKKIKSITEIENLQKTICITVDNKDSLYVSNDCIVVHNTSIIPHLVENIHLNSSSVGHALPFTAKVLKRNGFVPIVTLKEGDEICGGNGEFVKVKGIYPQGKREMFKIYFSDGATTVCDKEHLWTVATLNEKFMVCPLKTLMNQGLCAYTGRVKYRIPLVQPVNFSQKKLPIHPYLLGSLINGTFNRGDVMTFRTKHREVLPKIKELLARHNFKLTEPITNNDTGVEECLILSKTETVTNNWLNDKLHELGMRNMERNEKFIPPIYLFGSPEQRRQLLNGLIDTFGFFSHKSDTEILKAGNKHYFTVEFTSQSERLLKDIKFLAESLGGLTDMHEVSESLHQVSENDFINTFEGWFKISIKVRTFGMRVINNEFIERCNINKVLLQRTIKKVEPLNQKIEAICIEVDEPNGLFVTNDFIVTHNTTVNHNKIAYITFTGKAAMVLRKKGIPATTIHNLIYEYKVEKDARTGIIKRTYFEKKPRLPQGLKLIIVDEFSMVGKDIMADLASYGIPILMFGDPCQLPPVGGGTNPYLNKFNIMLTEIHRQAADNPILILATDIRNGNINLQYCDHGRLKILPKNSLDKTTMFWADQVICGTNQSRHDINNSFRRHLNRVSLTPVEGDKVICIKNNWNIIPVRDFFLINGMTGRISNLSINKRGKPIFDFLPDFLDEPFYSLPYDPKIFTGASPSVKNWSKFDTTNQFDYGYAITCHKAQGDQFEKVVVWEEMLGRDDHIKWLYTAITRCQDSLVIYH